MAAAGDCGGAKEASRQTTQTTGMQIPAGMKPERDFRLNCRMETAIIGNAFGEEDEHWGADNAPEHNDVLSDTYERAATNEDDAVEETEEQADPKDDAPVPVSDAPTIASVAGTTVSPRKNYKRPAKRGDNPLSAKNKLKGDTLTTGGSVTRSNQLSREKRNAFLESKSMVQPSSRSIKSAAAWVAVQDTATL
ncbi:hypothetical protein ZWY2020_010779 [Hordeum vulgare]|nr:hypothetical protein ZWY2020_010779 [Hordeum vulgare]